MLPKLEPLIADSYPPRTSKISHYGAFFAEFPQAKKGVNCAQVERMALAARREGGRRAPNTKTEKWPNRRNGATQSEKRNGAAKPEDAGETKRRSNNRDVAAEQYSREDRERSNKYSKYRKQQGQERRNQPRKTGNLLEKLSS